MASSILLVLGVLRMVWRDTLVLSASHGHRETLPYIPESQCFSSRSNEPTFQSFNLRLMALLGADGYFGRAGRRLLMAGCMRVSGNNYAHAGSLRARQLRLAHRTPD